jgi:hypothetical protein
MAGGELCLQRLAVIELPFEKHSQIASAIKTGAFYRLFPYVERHLSQDNPFYRLITPLPPLCYLSRDQPGLGSVLVIQSAHHRIYLNGYVIINSIEGSAYRTHTNTSFYYGSLSIRGAVGELDGENGETA